MSREDDHTESNDERERERERDDDPALKELVESVYSVLGHDIFSGLTREREREKRELQRTHISLSIYVRMRVHMSQ